MEPRKALSTPSLPPGTAYGQITNGGAQRYLLEAESSTGYTAWRLADGTTLISPAEQVSLPASAFLTFWACGGYEDTSPLGEITTFDCHGNNMVTVDVTALPTLEYLDCSYNKLQQLDLRGLSQLQALDVDDNQLESLDVRHLPNLRVLNCANNHLVELDLAGMDALEILGCSGNPLATLRTAGCTSLRDVTADRNTSGT